MRNFRCKPINPIEPLDLMASFSRVMSMLTPAGMLLTRGVWLGALVELLEPFEFLGEVPAADLTDGPDMAIANSELALEEGFCDELLLLFLFEAAAPPPPTEEVEADPLDLSTESSVVVLLWLGADVVGLAPVLPTPPP